MKNYRFLWWTIFGIILIFNIPPISNILKENYTYSNIDGSFIYSEEGGQGFSYTSTLRNYGIFLCRNSNKEQTDNRLFRTFTFKPWYFWEWSDMIFHSERFLLPYLDTTKIK